jgi:hypothetical protein
MTSESPQEAFIWVWLPEAEEPVVAGPLHSSERRLACASTP